MTRDKAIAEAAKVLSEVHDASSEAGRADVLMRIACCYVDIARLLTETK